MKIILSSKRDHYVARVGILLVTLALIVGMTGCFAPFPTQYELTISSTEGGSVTTPGEGKFTHDAGTVVNLVAEAHEGYRFGEWTGDVDTIADVHAAATTITMNGYSTIEVDFEPGYSVYVSSTLGGSVTEPGEGTFIYAASTVVDLVAEPIEGYAFEYWNGDVETIADINVATTNITMYDNYSIKAVFSFNITQIAAGYLHTVGLMTDGSVVAAGNNGGGQCNVGGWDLN